MKKNGYTLIELIAVIVIIALIATVVAINLDHTVDSNKNKKVARFKNDMEKAACAYIDLDANKTIRSACYNNCTVTANQLINGGLISDDLNDPVTGNKVSGSLSVSITWDSEGTKICTLNR